MSFFLESCKTKQITNEIDRVAVALPSNATFYSNQQYIVVAFDATPDVVTPSILGVSDLPFLANYQVFSALCDDRAIRTVDHRLVVNSKTVTPEQYLGLWRSALKQPLTPQEFNGHYSLKLLIVLSGPLLDVRSTKTHWTSSPFANFDEFETAYRGQMTYLDDDHSFRLELDLSHENSARDAFYGASLLRSAKEKADTRTSMILRPADINDAPNGTTSIAQRDLFALSSEEA